MSNFVILTKAEFEEFLPDNFVTVDIEGCKEVVYEITSSNPNVNVRIYSTVDVRTNQTRDLGMDAIRVIFWDAVNNRPIGKGKKILRVQRRTSIGSRIQQRILEFLGDADNQEAVNFDYVKAVLSHNAVSWMGFANSLLDGLNEYGRLTDGQLAYVLGDKNPKGKPTMEAKVLQADPNFAQNFTVEEEEEEPEPEEVNYEQEMEDEPFDGLPVLAHDEEEDDEPELSREVSRAFSETMDLAIASEDGERFYRPSTPVPEEIQEVLFGSPDEPDYEIPAVGDNNIPTSNYTQWDYPFPVFNPVQSEVLPHVANPKNMVIGANTSAGKTICAEFLMDHTLDMGLRVVYLSPLKALTQEKYSDWQERFPNEEITILTGDYTLSDTMKAKLGRSNIIVMTSEMCDSRTRKMKSEKNFWLKQVGLVVVDEAHILSTNRGHAVEAGLMRFTKINPNARILLLSATMPNVGELGNWLTVLNGKETDVIFSTWRPVELQISYEHYRITTNRSGFEDYWASQERKRSRAVELVLAKPDEKFLVFVHDKNTGRDIVRRLTDAGVETHFHSADLELNDRLEIENSFQNRDNGIKVLVSTSTLAWGRNLPARNVVIVGVHRGLGEVDQLDIIQMAGRAGRYGIDDEGFVFLIIPERTTAVWQDVFINPRPVESRLNDHNTLAFHILAEVETKEVKRNTDARDWFSRSLACLQSPLDFTSSHSARLIDDLLQMEMVTSPSPGALSITGLGRVSAWLYFSPYDVWKWFCNFDKLFNREEVNNMDLALTWAIGDIPSNDLGYIPKDLQDLAARWSQVLYQDGFRASGAVLAAIASYHAITGETQSAGTINNIKRQIVFDIDRIAYALNLIDTMYARWGKEDIWNVLPLRMKYGIGEEMVDLVKIPGVGGKRAKRLFDAGFTSIVDVADGRKRSKLIRLFTPAFGKKIHFAAKRMIAA